MAPHRLPILAALAVAAFSPAHAALEADLVTTRGTVTIELEYAKTPKAVANFISLAQGSRAWMDSRRGAVNTGPFFNGLPFHYVSNTAEEKLAECGSKDGSGSDDPGYTIKDEFDPSLTHQAYVVAMASEGPNSGGSRFHLAGNLAMPVLDQRNVVFGRIPSSQSRSVVDQILTAGSGQTSLLSVTIRGTDPLAASFDASAIPLPVVGPVSGSLAIQPGLAANLFFPRAPMTVLRAYSGTDLISWAPHYRSFAGMDELLPAATHKLDNAADPRRFYHLSQTTYTDALGSSHFANRTITTNSPGLGELVYQFNASGTGGSYSNTPDPDFPFFNFTGTFSVEMNPAPRFDGYFFKMLVATPGLGGASYVDLSGGYDSIGTSAVTGRSFSRVLTATKSLIFEDQGSLELTRP
jgi:peptidyl-prolyl cis-trans isomerase A (cyclophilin A)